jgi:hypothetical protein
MEASSCTPFTGHINASGYGTVYMGGRNRLAHRVAWELHRGPIPAGMTIDHLCHVPDVCPGGITCPHRRCINVEHMAVVTVSENAKRGSKGQRGVARGRQQRAKTHCPSGHEYDEGNTRWYRGYRYCRACERARPSRHRKSHDQDAWKP